MLYIPKGVTKVTKKLPQMKDQGGHLWSWAQVLLSDGSKVDGHYDSTRGELVYFKIADEWHKARIEDFAGNDRDYLVIDLRDKRPPLDRSIMVEYKLADAESQEEWTRLIIFEHEGEARAVLDIAEFDRPYDPNSCKWLKKWANNRHHFEQFARSWNERTERQTGV